MAEHLNPEEEGLLQSALSTAFTPAPLPRQSALPEQSPEAAVASPAPQPAPAPDPSVSTAEFESAEAVWRAEYEAHVAEWRERSAEQRQKAEEERARWETIRAREREDASLKASVSSHARSEGGWESLSGPPASGTSPSPADARDMVSGEGQGRHSKEYLEAVLPGAPSSSSTPPDAHAHERTTSEPESSRHDKWEDIPSSLASSYPSLSFPSDPHSPSTDPQAHRHRPTGGHPHVHHTAHGHGHAHHVKEDRAGSTTLSVFDASLSPKTRALALLSSLAINVLLPFVNGVMLGFGEIFAKNVVVRWFGWKPAGPGRTAAGVGLRGTEGTRERELRTRKH
ncbi:hypothetical protein AcV7_006524 [Taiwanofungus camphoratus]|nr:hypothetical protein AcV7_006524 [Antrodia cinnamomea]